MNTPVLLEVCVDSIESAQAAERGGADRIELCADLFEGGITPSHGLIKVVRDRIRIGLGVMIRPRGGDFCYSDDEFEVMQYDVVTARELHADMIVLGLLRPDGAVDIERTQKLVELARPLPVTFHRAFDMTRDPFEALEALIALRVERVLTSGQEKSVPEGLDLITELVQRAGGRIIVMPGGGITERNVEKVLRQSRAKEFHVSGSGSRASRMTFRNTRVFMGAQMGPPEYTIKVADESRVRAFRGLAG